MNPKVLAFSGVKQAGKSTSVRFLHGILMKKYDIIDFFDISDRGELIVNTTTINKEGEEVLGKGILDIDRKDLDFVEYAEKSIWPFVKSYNFADPLKQLCINLFGLSYGQCYGTDDEKNTEAHTRWKDMPSTPDSQWMINAGVARGTNMTAREFMQYFGTDICRRIKYNIWVDFCIKRIIEEQPELSLIGDCRFINEFEALKSVGAKVIRLTKGRVKAGHKSETELDESNFDWNKFDLIIDNKNMTVKESNESLLNSLNQWGWL